MLARQSPGPPPLRQAKSRSLHLVASVTAGMLSPARHLHEDGWCSWSSTPAPCSCLSSSIVGQRKQLRDLMPSSD